MNVTADCELRLLLGLPWGKHNVSVVSARSRDETVLGARNQVTHSRSLRMYTSEPFSPLSAYKVQGFVASISVAYACISEQQHTLRTAIERTSEERGAMQRYGTVGMNYVQLSAHELSDEVPSNIYSDVEGDNHVFTSLARRTSEIEAGSKPSGYGSGSGSASFTAQQR